MLSENAGPVEKPEFVDITTHPNAGIITKEEEVKRSENMGMGTKYERQQIPLLNNGVIMTEEEIKRRENEDRKDDVYGSPHMPFSPPTAGVHPNIRGNDNWLCCVYCADPSMCCCPVQCCDGHSHSNGNCDCSGCCSDCPVCECTDCGDCGGCHCGAIDCGALDCGACVCIDC